MYRYQKMQLLKLGGIVAAAGVVGLAVYVANRVSGPQDRAETIIPVARSTSTAERQSDAAGSDTSDASANAATSEEVLAEYERAVLEIIREAQDESFVDVRRLFADTDALLAGVVKRFVIEQDAAGSEFPVVLRRMKMTGLTPLFLTAENAMTDPEADELHHHRELYTVAAIEGDWGRASDAARLMIVRDSTDVDGWRRLAYASMKDGDERNATRAMKEARDAAEASGAVESSGMQPALAHIAKLQADRYFEAGNPREALGLYHEAVDRFRRSGDRYRQDLAYCLAGASTLAANSGDLEGGIEARSEAAAIHRDLFGEASTQFGEDHDFIGTVLLFLDKPNEALQHLTRAINVYREHFGDQDPRTAHVLSLIGGAYVQIGDWESARASLLPSLKVLLETDGPTTQRTLIAAQQIASMGLEPAAAVTMVIEDEAQAQRFTRQFGQISAYNRIQPTPAQKLMAAAAGGDAEARRRIDELLADLDAASPNDRNAAASAKRLRRQLEGIDRQLRKSNEPLVPMTEPTTPASSAQ